MEKVTRLGIIAANDKLPMLKEEFAKRGIVIVGVAPDGKRLTVLVPLDKVDEMYRLLQQK